jgi:chemotaxis protein MotB
MSSGGRKRREHHEEHENHERWLVTYADMVTLLMVLFIVMFAMSQVDQKKFNALKEGLAAGFGQSTSVLNGASSILEEPGTAPEAPVAPTELAADVTPQEQTRIQQAVAQNDQLAKERQQASVKAEVSRLDKILKQIEKALRARGLQDDVTAKIDERGLVLSLVSRHVVFQPNLAELTPRGKEVLATIGPVLRHLTDPLDIDGHTNQVKVKPKYFPTDWELSAARAVRVLRYLNEVTGLPNSRMEATAFGHTKPLVDPRKPGSQYVNKRVDIVIRTALPADARALLQKAAAAQDNQGGAS